MTSFQRDLFYAHAARHRRSTVCFIAPDRDAPRCASTRATAAYIIESSNRLLIAGLVFLALAIIGASSLITDYLFDLGGHWYWPAAVALLLAALWFVRPLVRHVRGVSSGP